MDYDWDEEKRQANLDKHGVDFADVAGFDWVSALIEPDERREYGERRLSALGHIAGRLHFLIYVERRGSIRVISLRKANNREKQTYARKTQS